jgi:hypothetical protein
LGLFGAVILLLLEVLDRPLSEAQVLDVAFAALGLAQIGIGLAFLRRRIRTRRFDQSIEQYWSDSQVRSSSIVLWATIEGAGMLSWVGYLMTGGIAPAAIGLLSLVVLVGLRPVRLEASAGTSAHGSSV